MPNKFADSLKTMEQNTSLENQGVNAQSPSTLDTPAETPVEPVKEQGNKKSAAKKSSRPKPEPEKKASSAPNGFNVGGALDKLNTKGLKGKTITVYLKNEVLEELDKISNEKNINRSKIIDAILEEALVKHPPLNV